MDGSTIIVSRNLHPRSIGNIRCNPIAMEPLSLIMKNDNQRHLMADGENVLTDFVLNQWRRQAGARGGGGGERIIRRWRPLVYVGSAKRKLILS